MTGKRKYDSSRRRAEAEETRARIVDAAGGLFEQRGYAGTSVRDIADVAGVSPETVYSAFGSKATLLSRALDERVEGDGEPRALVDQPWVRDLAVEPDPDRRLALLAEHGVAVIERVAPLLRAVRAAALSEPDIATLLDEVERARQQDLARLLDLVMGDRPLRAGVERGEAIAWLTTLGGDQVLLDLVERRGWSIDAYRRWMVDTVRRTLFDP
jgi:AcrR family transcriptional regulator